MNKWMNAKIIFTRLINMIVVIFIKKRDWIICSPEPNRKRNQNRCGTMIHYSMNNSFYFSLLFKRRARAKTKQNKLNCYIWKWELYSKSRYLILIENCSWTKGNPNAMDGNYARQNKTRTQISVKLMTYDAEQSCLQMCNAQQICTLRASFICPKKYETILQLSCY